MAVNIARLWKRLQHFQTWCPETEAINAQQVAELSAVSFLPLGTEAHEVSP